MKLMTRWKAQKSFAWLFQCDDREIFGCFSVQNEFFGLFLPLLAVKPGDGKLLWQDHDHKIYKFPRGEQNTAKRG
tara:strand:- start:1156 stop:1380 length:225 start_codon:yes stop_codon:yes gene_type:complete